MNSQKLPQDPFLCAYLLASINKRYWLRFLQTELKANAHFFEASGYFFNPTSDILLMQELSIGFAWFTLQLIPQKNQKLTQIFLAVLGAEYNQEPLQMAVHQKILNYTNEHNFPPINQGRMHARFSYYNQLLAEVSDNNLKHLYMGVLSNCLPFFDLHAFVQHHLLNSLQQYTHALRQDLKAFETLP